MRSGGWKPFWAALGAALLVLLPLTGGTVLLARQQARVRVEAARSQSGVAVELPKTGDRMTALVCVAGEAPGFMLVYANAGQNCVHLLAVPGALEVPFAGEEATLTECYAAAGPARCREALAELFPLPEDTRYLALAPATLEQLTRGLGTVRVGFSGALSVEEQAQLGLPAGVQELSVGASTELLRWMEAEAGLAPRACAAARAALWDAFFRQKLELLPATLPDGLRAVSGALLTDLTAQDYYRLEETLEFLANNAAEVSGAALPGEWDAATGRYTAGEEARAAVQALLNISPTAGQAASESEP